MVPVFASTAEVGGKVEMLVATITASSPRARK